MYNKPAQKHSLGKLPTMVETEMQTLNFKSHPHHQI